MVSLGVLPHTAKLSSGKTFMVGIENERLRENFCGSSFFYKNVLLANLFVVKHSQKTAKLSHSKVLLYTIFVYKYRNILAYLVNMEVR